MRCRTSPFGRVGVSDPTYRDKKFVTHRIHNYFFAKTLDKLRPGGIMAFVTSHNTLDNPAAQRLREHLAERADLVGAIRLPNRRLSGYRRSSPTLCICGSGLPGEKPGNLDWVNTGKVTLRGRYGDEAEYPVNQYFLNNPDAIQGVQKATGSQYAANEYTVESAAGPPLSDKLPQFTRRVTGGAPKIQPYVSKAFLLRRSSDDAPSARPSERPEGKFFVGDGGDLKQVSGGREVTPAFRNKKAEQRVRSMLALRDDARRLLDMERDNAADADLAKVRGELQGKYTSFVDTYGRINTVTNRNLMRLDPDSSFVRALEVNRKGEWIRR